LLRGPGEVAKRDALETPARHGLLESRSGKRRVPAFRGQIGWGASSKAGHAC
jgi:hypothetical protein